MNGAAGHSGAERLAGEASPKAAPAEEVWGYTLPMRAMHWTTAALLLGSYVAVWTIGSAATGAQAALLAMLHRSFGVTILALTLVRFVWRLRTKVPPLPANLPVAQRLSARASVVVLYLLLVLQPVLGVVASMLHGDRITVFGDVALPNLLPVTRPLARQIFEVHGWVAMLLLALILMHVAAALYHHLIRRDEVLSGMLPVIQRMARPVRPGLAKAPPC